MDLETGWTNAWNSVATFLPKLAAFLIILLIGWLLAKVLSKATDVVLERVGFDRAVERGGVGRALESSRYDVSDLVGKIVHIAVLLLALQMAFGVFGPNAVSDLMADIIAWLPQAIVAIIIVVVAAAIASAVREIVTGVLGGLPYGRMLANIAAVFILGLGIIAALDQIGVAATITTPVLVAVLATVAGILIVGIGGGLVRPMQQVWERWLGTLERESANVRREVQRHQQGRSLQDAPTMVDLSDQESPSGSRL